MPPRHKGLDMTGLKTISVRERRYLLNVEMLGSPADPVASLRSFFPTLPAVGAARDLIRAAELAAAAVASDRCVLWMIDSVFIESGLSPILIDLIRRGAVGCLVMSGGAAVRDFELATHGRTAEDPSSGLSEGQFGLGRETIRGLTTFVNDGVRRGFGIGESLGRSLLESKPQFGSASLLAACAECSVPATVHVTLGADGFHHHPEADGALIGKGGIKDVQILAAQVAGLTDGGMVISASPDAALLDTLVHAAVVSRNLGIPVRNYHWLRLGEAACDAPSRETAGMSDRLNVPGPSGIIVPLFAAAIAGMTG